MELHLETPTQFRKSSAFENGFYGFQMDFLAGILTEASLISYKESVKPKISRNKSELCNPLNNF